MKNAPTVSPCHLKPAVGEITPASCSPELLSSTHSSPILLMPQKKRLTFMTPNVNRFFCGINNIGELCVDPNNSPIVGGGFWPKGTPDQYIFNSGLQLAGVVSTLPADGFPWRGDTVVAFFMDPRGDQAQGD